MKFFIVLIFERSTLMIELLKSRPLSALAIVLFFTGFVLFPSLTNGWLDWDDKTHILDNNLVRSLSWERIKLIFQTTELNGSYIPLPIITWAINYKFGGWNPLGFHAVNLVLHLCNTALVFLFVKRLSNQNIVAFLTALLFGVHPMHVEPVVWITGRKDVLYSFFLLGSMNMWGAYNSTQKHRIYLYLFALFLFMLSLFSKGVAVVLPLFLLLTDYYQGRTDYMKLAVEKLPFFALSLVFGFIAISSQQQTAALGNVTEIPFHLSIVTSSYSLTFYLIQVLVPFQIGGFHPYPSGTEGIPSYMIASVLTPILLLIVILVFRKNRNIIFGVVFMLIGFTPVIQFLPVGDGIVADRYAYIPYLGAFFVFSWVTKSVYDQIKDRPTVKYVFGFVLVGYFVWLGSTAMAATQIWKNSLSLWTNVINQHPHAEKGHINRGRYYVEHNKLEQAKSDFDKALEIAPNLTVIHQERGLYFQRIKDYRLAADAFKRALEIDSMYFPARLNLGINYMRIQQLDTAIQVFTHLEKLDPRNLLVHLNKGVVFEQMDNFPNALVEYSKAIAKHPLDYKGYQYRTVLHFRMGNYQKAQEDVELWIRLNSSDGKAFLWRSRIEFVLKNYPQARVNLAKAEKLGAVITSEYRKLVSDSSQVHLGKPK
ncbi:MAG TPA: hypothetical protein DCR04_01830 [Flavobacteriales bacterium]|nr:hypothetical protein [Flavobacteriales bacterium]